MFMNKEFLPNNSKAIYNANFKNQGVYYMDFNSDDVKQNLYILEYEVQNNAKYEVYDETDTAEKQYIVLAKLDVANADKEYVNTVKHLQNLLVSIVSTTKDVEDYDKYHAQQVEELENYMEYGAVNPNVKLSITKEMYDNFINKPLESDKSFVVDRSVMVESTIEDNKIVYSRDKGIYLNDGKPYVDDPDNVSRLPVVFGDNRNWNKISKQEQEKKAKENNSFKGIKSSEKKKFAEYGLKMINEKIKKVEEMYAHDPEKCKKIARELIDGCVHDYAAKHQEIDRDNER